MTPKPVFKSPDPLFTVESQNVGADTIPDVTIARQRPGDPSDAVQKAIEAGTQSVTESCDNQNNIFTVLSQNYVADTI